MMHFIWIVIVIGSVVNVIGISVYSYESMGLVVISSLGCFREIYLSALNWGLCYELAKAKGLTKGKL